MHCILNINVCLCARARARIPYGSVDRYDFLKICIFLTAVGAFEYIWLGFSSLFLHQENMHHLKVFFLGGDGEGLKAYKTLATPPTHPQTPQQSWDICRVLQRLQLWLV